MSPRIVLVLAGPAGSGKSAVGEILGQRPGWTFIEGDQLHPASNRAKMAAGIPLDEQDRWPWFDAIRKSVAETPGNLVVSTSALKPAYRAYLCQGWEEPRLAFLCAPRETLSLRLASRKGHFFPAGLLDSQLALEQRPGPENCVEALASVEAIAGLIGEKLDSGALLYRNG